MRGALADGLGEIDSAFTTGPRDATAIAGREAAAGRRLIIALGGDGTISEVADGVLLAGARRAPPRSRSSRAARAAISAARWSCPHEIGAAARHIRETRAQAVDAGRVRYRAHDGSEAVRHFVNVASFGFSSAVASRANASSKRFGGKHRVLRRHAARADRARQPRRLADAWTGRSASGGA